MDNSDHIDVASLEPMFRPAAVAIIGASSDPARIGGMPLAFLKANRFAGPIYPVNPRGPTYTDWGRMRRLSANCSKTCAVQPAVRPTAKVGVNSAAGMSTACRMSAA